MNMLLGTNTDQNDLVDFVLSVCPYLPALRLRKQRSRVAQVKEGLDVLESDGNIIHGY